MAQAAARNTIYHDLLIRIILSVVAAHFIIAFGINETFFQLLLLPDYYRSLAGSAVIAFLLISAIRQVSVGLDRKHPWREAAFTRTVLQLLFGVGAISILAFFLASVYFAVNGINILQTVYLRYDFPVIVVFILLINFYYLCYYLFMQLQTVHDHKLPKQENKTLSVIMFNSGMENLPQDVAGISCFFHEGKYNFARTGDGSSHLISYSLDQLEAQLDTQQFFRISRTMILNRRACRSFINLEYGKLEVVIEPPTKEPVIVSQKRAPQFKKWLESQPAGTYL